MLTSDYRWRVFPFERWTAAQRPVVPLLDQAVNVVVCLPTGTGKTALFEGAAAWHLAQGGSVLYACPFRALAEEKYALWAADGQFSSHGVRLATGEREDGVGRLAVATVEKALGLLEDGLIDEPDFFGFDEADLLFDGERGAAAEALTMRAGDGCCRLMLMSATMPCSREVAGWLHSLNRLPTKLIRGARRTHALEPSVHVCRPDRKLAEACRILRQQAQSGKVLVFVHRKADGRKLLRMIGAADGVAAFYHAGLPAERRRSLESAFHDPSCPLRIMVTTSSLSRGVNL